MTLWHLPRAGAPRSDERGETLIELMATVVLLGVSIVALIGSLMGAITTSSQNKRATRASNEAVNAVEYIRGQNYIPCASVSSYTTPANVGRYRYQVMSVQRVVDRNVSPAAWTSAAGCTSTNDQGLQLIKVRVTALGSPNVRRSLSFVKRNKVCPTGHQFAGLHKC